MRNTGQALALAPFRSDEIPETSTVLAEMQVVIQQLQDRLKLISMGKGDQAANRAGEVHDSLQRLDRELKRNFLQPSKD